VGFQPSFKKKTSVEKWLVGLASTPDKVGQKFENSLTYDVILENSSLGLIDFFSTESGRHSESVEGLNTSLAPAAGDIWR